MSDVGSGGRWARNVKVRGLVEDQLKIDIRDSVRLLLYSFLGIPSGLRRH